MPPVNNNFADATELNLVGQRRRIRSVDGTTVGATTEVGEPLDDFRDGVTVNGTVWYKLSADADTTGPFRVAIPSAGDPDDPDTLFMAAVLYRQNGVGFGGLQYVDDSTNRFPDGLHNNCEGYAQGRDNYLWEFAVGGGEVYYIQVATHDYSSTVDSAFTLEWCYDPVDEPTILTGTKSANACPGTPLATHGWNIAYFDAFDGFPARFLAGRRVPNTPTLPADGHAFYCEEVREFDTVHIRRLIIGWTEAYGPFLYGYLEPNGWVRTWSVDNEDPAFTGAADSVGGLHYPIIFYDNDSGINERTTIRTVASEGAEVTTTWAAATMGSSVSDSFATAGALAFTETGQAWSTLYGTWFVVGGEAAELSGGGIAYVDLGGDSYSIETFWHGRSGGLAIGIDSATLNRWAAVYLTTDNTLKLDQDVSGAYSNVATVSVPVTGDTVTYHIQVVVNGRHVTVYIDGELLINDALLHASFVGRTKAGLFASGSPATNRFGSFGVVRALVRDVSMAWGGPGRPGSIFGLVYPVTGSRYVVEWDLSGNELRTVAEDGFLWCSLDGTTQYRVSGGNLEGYDLAGASISTLVSGVGSGTPIGVRSTTGEVVLRSSNTALRIVDADAATYRDITLPTRPSSWAVTFGRHWNSMGVTADGQHLFLGLFYPQTYPVPGGSGGREFVTDVWWVDLDTGDAERKFILAHPFHDTYLIPDVTPSTAVSSVADVRLYRQADVGR